MSPGARHKCSYNIISIWGAEYQVPNHHEMTSVTIVLSIRRHDCRERVNRRRTELACAFDERLRTCIYTRPNKGCPRGGMNNDEVILLLLNVSSPLIYKTGLRLWFPTISGKQSRDCRYVRG